MEALRERFGKYHVLGKIAQGGMAEVYKVKTVGIAGFEKVQALKRILPSSAREGRFIRSFIDEARIAVELTHRNIVQVFDFGKADGELFLAMELIEGKDLRTAMSQAVARSVLPPIPVSAYIIAEVASGLDYAHRKTDGYGGSLGIVHCDVSPSNVMLSTDGYVKILDFGIARATFSSALERRRLRGKPRYMAPEQTLGEPPTPAADVFALGIIAWELFTGLPLFRGPNLKAILSAVRTTVPPRIDRLNPQVPREIADAIQTALSREPTARGTAADVTGALIRTAMLSGSRPLALWLGELESSPSQAEVPWQSDHTSVSVARPTTVSRTSHSALTPPVRPSATASLANVPFPPHEVGEGTPGFPDAMPYPNESPSDRQSTAEVKRIERFSVEPSTTVVARYEPTASVTSQRYADATSARWGHEATSVGGGKLADALPDTSFRDREATVPTEPHLRPSYEVLQLGIGANPSSLRFDDDVTQHGFSLPVPNDTSYDDLEVEAEQPAPAEVLHDEPIDDDLGVLGDGVLSERRRTVVVAGLLSGAPAETLRPVTRSLGELAYQRGGVVIAQDDDFLLVAFGLEIAGEDDVAIAMGWALDGGAMARDVGTEHGGGGGIVLRIGARTGVATTAGTDGAARIPPDASEEARALAREASPDRPLFVGTTGRLTSGLYSLREVPAVKRVARRSKVIEVVGPRGFDERDRERLERRGTFVGRTAQLAELEVWFQRAIAADRRLVALLSGAAGTGKSRLVAELVARRTATGTPMRIVTTAASPAHHLAPFAMVIDLYQAALGLPPTRGRAARQQLVQRLQHLMTGAGVSLERAREVATDLDRAMELRDGVSVGAPEVADLRPRISAGLAAFRAAMADRDRPQLTIIEDIHLADSASLEVLRHTLAVAQSGPELLVLTARPEGPPPPPVDVVLMVSDLVGGELRALIADRLGDAASPLNIAAVLARGGGNPLFIEELAEAVREAGDDVPASARDVVAARIDRLSPKAKTALRYAAVLGGTIRVRLIEELLDEESLGSELDELIEAGFLVRPASAAGSTEGDLVFARGLVREVVHDSLSARAQRESHARVGRLLSSRFFAGREEPPAVIAEHLERGGEPAGAAAFWLRAGRLALTASDADAAVGCFSRTLVLERELGVTPPTPTSRARRREALAGREEAHRLIGDLASNPGDLDELQRLCEGDAARLADVAIRRAQRMLRWGDYANATVATVVAEDHAAAAGDDRFRGEALRVRAEILERLGRFDEALAVVGQARELFHRNGAIADEMAAMIGRGRIHLLRAHYEAARDAYRPVVALIDKTGDPWLERIVTNHVAVIEMCLGNFTTAMASAMRSLDLCRRYGDRAREGDALSVMGIVQLEVGLYDAAATTFAAALDILGRTASRWSRADCLIYAGVCEVRRGKADGIKLLDEALSEARRLGARYLEANALVARAGAQLRSGGLVAALEDAADGTFVAQQATLVGYEIQGLARHALALSRHGGHTAEAGALVHRALAMLEHQRYLEGSEEEVYAACVEVLATAGAGDRASMVRERGRASARCKLDALIDPAWKAAYAAIPEVKQLLG
ncbi:MAG: serine/threonine protein kinase with repeat [Myxococcales bacterium]|nr:serine/threonine protein kinase with repeat [Myxococcales bacterium]